MNLGALETLMSGAMALFSYALLIAAVWKLFQIGTDLAEIKKLLSETRVTTNAVPKPLPAGPISLESAEALLREVAAESEHTRPTV